MLRIPSGKLAVVRHNCTTAIPGPEKKILRTYLPSQKWQARRRVQLLNELSARIRGRHGPFYGLHGDSDSNYRGRKFPSIAKLLAARFSTLKPLRS